MTTNNFEHIDLPQLPSANASGGSLYEQLNMANFRPNPVNNDSLCSFALGASEPKVAEKDNEGYEDKTKKDGTDQTVKSNDKLEAPEGSARKKRLELEEAIKKADEALPAKDFDKTIAELHHLSLLWKSFTILGDLKKPLDDLEKGKDLQRTQMVELATKTNELSNKLVAPIEARMRYAKFLAEAGGFSEAEKVALEARELSERFTKPAKITEHFTVSPLAVEREGRNKAVLGFELAKNFPSKMSPFADTVTETNVFLAKLYLGADADWTKGVPKVIGDGRFFDPVKAFDAADKARKSIMDSFLYDPLEKTLSNEAAELKHLYNGLDAVFKDPAAVKLSERKNSDGQKFDPDRIKEISEKMAKRKQDNLKSTGDSLLMDAGMMMLWGARPNAYPKPMDPRKQPEQKK
ncbi:MAG: hypothetical protein K2X93_16610 [Candidatus Obscuribacterales bacterium]|nr:hypothetical protein [Candidatus Obscuribacterales bacterium]